MRDKSYVTPLCQKSMVPLRPTHGGRKAAVRHHFKLKFNVTATGFDRGNTAAAVELLLAVEIKKSTAAVANVT